MRNKITGFFFSRIPKQIPFPTDSLSFPIAPIEGQSCPKSEELEVKKGCSAREKSTDQNLDASWLEVKCAFWFKTNPSVFGLPLPLLIFPSLQGREWERGGGGLRCRKSWGASGQTFLSPWHPTSFKRKNLFFQTPRSVRGV